MDARVELPPADRTVGQLVAETIRLFGGRFWPSLALGLVVATFDQLALGQGGTVQATLLVLAAPFFTLAYIGACAIASGERHPRQSVPDRVRDRRRRLPAGCGARPVLRPAGTRVARARWARGSGCAARTRRLPRGAPARPSARGAPTTSTRSDRWRRSSSSTSSAAAPCCSCCTARRTRLFGRPPFSPISCSRRCSSSARLSCISTRRPG